MIYKVYSVYDSKVSLYAKPFYMRTRGEAIRGFTEVVNNKETDLGKFPGDFTLFELGEYSEDTGKFTTYDTPYNVGLALDFIKGE